MLDPRLRKMADVLVNYSVETRPGDWVAIQSTFLGEPLVVACVEAALEAGAHPQTFWQSDEVSETLIREGSDDQLSWISPTARLLMEQANRQIGILAPRNTRTMASADPSRLAFMNKSMEPMMETMMKRSADGDLLWTGAAYPTHAGAQDASMSLRQYENFIFEAGLLNEDDPVAAWRDLGKRQERIIDWLRDRKEVHIKGPGTDLRVGIGGRTWLNDDGHKNFPGGEVFTGPIEDATEGIIQFTYPAYLQGREVSGVRLAFQGGEVKEASAQGDDAFLQQMLNMDEGARRLGEFAFGLNQGIQQFSKNTLFDEKIGGTLHMALGRAYPESGGQNMSALHWDMVYDLREGSEVRVDGQMFLENGNLCV